MEALQQASFRLLRIRSFDRDGVLLVEDLATGRTLSILDRDIPDVYKRQELCRKLGDGMKKAA